MILCHPQIERVFDFEESRIQSLVIEEPGFFRELMLDLYDQADGMEGRLVLSEDGKELAVGSCVELLDNCLHFSINSRTLVNRLTAAMERAAMSEAFFLKTSALLQQVEEYIDELAFNFDCDVACERCTAAGLLKAAGIYIRDEYDDPLERLADYMELIREFDRDKLFVLVNLRSFFADEHVEKFLDTVSAHGYRVLMLDSVSRKKLRAENRITIDNDLCEF